MIELEIMATIWRDQKIFLTIRFFCLIVDSWWCSHLRGALRSVLFCRVDQTTNSPIKTQVFNIWRIKTPQYHPSCCMCFDVMIIHHLHIILSIINQTLYEIWNVTISPQRKNFVSRIHLYFSLSNYLKFFSTGSRLVLKV